MTDRGLIGELIGTRRSGGGSSLEWKICDFLSLDGERGDYYTSPFFDACDGEWCLRIHPYGILNYTRSDWVSVFLFRVDAGPPKAFNVTLGIRGAEGVENQKGISQEFSEDDRVCNWNWFCSRCELSDHQSRLMPGDALVFALDMKSEVPSVTRAYIDSFTQTVEESKEPEVATEGNQFSEKQAASDDEAEEENNGNNIDEDMGESKNKKKVKNTKKISFPARHADVIRSLKSILAGGSRADFTLKSGGGEWPVHRAILEARSGHFEALFRGEWAETDVGVVPFHDVTDQGALDVVLQFLYAGEVGGMSAENVFGIYAAAERFLLRDLKCACVEYMREEMCPGMVCDALALAETNGERELRESALQCFFREPARIYETEGWKWLKENRPAIIAELFEETIRRESKNRRKE